MISGELSPKLQELSVISEVIEQEDFEMSEKRYVNSLKSIYIFRLDITSQIQSVQVPRHFIVALIRYLLKI